MNTNLKNAQLIERATQAALDAGCKVIQDAIGVTTGDLAGMFFAGGPQEDAVRTALTAYLAAEREAAREEAVCSRCDVTSPAGALRCIHCAAAF